MLGFVVQKVILQNNFRCITGIILAETIGIVAIARCIVLIHLEGSFQGHQFSYSLSMN